MAQIYQEGERYFDAHDVELFYDSKHDVFMFADGRIFNESLDDSISQSKVERQRSDSQKPGASNTDVNGSRIAKPTSKSQQSIKSPEQTSSGTQNSRSPVNTASATKAVSAEIGTDDETISAVDEMDVKVPGIVKITGRALNYVLDRTWITVIISVILSWLSAFMAGVAVCFVFNNRVMKTWVRVVCITVSVVSLVYTMSSGYSMERAYSPGDRGNTDEIRFVLAINPGTTSLNTLKNLVTDSGYASTYSQSNNSVTIRTGTLDCVVYLDLAKKTVNAVEVYGTRKYELSIYPYNVLLKTNYGLFVFNMLEVNVGALLNDLENVETDLETYIREIYPTNSMGG